MDKEIAEGKIGNLGQYDLEFKGGKLVLKVSADISGGVAVAGLEVAVDGGQVLDKLAAAIPGTFDDALIAIAKAALLGK